MQTLNDKKDTHFRNIASQSLELHLLQRSHHITSEADSFLPYPPFSLLPLANAYRSPSSPSSALLRNIPPLLVFATSFDVPLPPKLSNIAYCHQSPNSRSSPGSPYVFPQCFSSSMYCGNTALCLELTPFCGSYSLGSIT